MWYRLLQIEIMNGLKDIYIISRGSLMLVLNNFFHPGKIAH